MNVDKVAHARTEITAMLAKMREISEQSRVFNTTQSISSTSEFGDILSTFKGAISNVDSLQTQSDQIKNSYLSGESGVSMSEVVLASQKSNLAFQGLVSVRNKLLEFYKDIMNMPV